MMRSKLFLVPILAFQLYKYLRFTGLCDCGLLRDALVTVFKHPWYSGYSDYVGLIDPYGYPWWIFHSLFSQNLETALMWLILIDTIVLFTLYRTQALGPFLVLAVIDSIVWFTSPTDMLVLWMLFMGIFISPLFSVLAAVTKFPVGAPWYYMQYDFSHPLSHPSLQSWRYILFIAMFALSWWTFWKRRHREQSRS